MTSTFKFGIIGLGVIGVGLGAYLVNKGLKGDKAMKPSEPAGLASAVTGQTPASPAADEVRPAPALQPVLPPPAPVAASEHNTGQAASPAPMGVRESRDDAERSFRPRPVETKESQAPVAAAPAIPADLTSHAPIGAAAPPISPPPASHAPEVARMSLQEQSATTRPAGTDKTAAAKPMDAAPAAPQKTTLHLVQAGDTFSSLAAKYLGSPKYANLIEKANPKINPNRLYVGTKLKIPAAPEPSKTTAAPASSGNTVQTGAAGNPKAKAPPPPPVDPAKAYTVQAGDTWSSLARQHLGDANWTVLYEYNKERFPANARTLKPGMVIEIPSKAELGAKK